MKFVRIIPIFLLCCCIAGPPAAGLDSQSSEVFAETHSSQLPANAKSCAECHSSPASGGSSRRVAMRAGFISNGKYIGVKDGGILHTLNYDSSAEGATAHGPRVTLNLLGDGYIEAVKDEELVRIAREERAASEGKIQGEVVYLTSVGQSDGAKVVGRFGWKAQHSSLLDASADALLNELGVANRVFPGNSKVKQTSENRTAAPDELDALVGFIRNTEPIAPDPKRSSTDGAKAGAKIFDSVGCSVCHIATLKTASPGTHVEGSGIIVSERLGNKQIHPFSDYLLHDIGTGDGIVQNVHPEDYAASTANKFRTAPLWGLRYRLWLMHDGKSVTYHQAIMRHHGEALEVTLKYTQLTPFEKEELREFLDSL